MEGVKKSARLGGNVYMGHAAGSSCYARRRQRKETFVLLESVKKTAQFNKTDLKTDNLSTHQRLEEFNPQHKLRLIFCRFSVVLSFPFFGEITKTHCECVIAPKC